MIRSLAATATAVALAVIATGCDTEPDRTPAPAAETFAGAQAEPPAVAADALQQRLNDHMARARAADVQEFRQMFPQHRDLVNEMLEDCRQMMRQMNMTPPRQFTDVETALENDLQRIPTMTDPELQSLLPQHLDHVQTVIDMRQSMMDDMM